MDLRPSWPGRLDRGSPQGHICAMTCAPSNSKSSKVRGRAPSALQPKQDVPDFSHEAALQARGIWPVAGCDEAGRGPLAGPVVAAAVVLDPANIPAGLDDSKRLTAKKRDILFEAICQSAQVGVALAPPERIDRDNILRASLWALAQAVRALPLVPRHVLVDGRDRIDVTCACDALIGGDARSLSIAAASIVAKVTRDRLMVALGRVHPGYGFEKHMGYGVAAHLEALRIKGPTPHHRRSFAPVRAAAEAFAPQPQKEPAHIAAMRGD